MFETLNKSEDGNKFEGISEDKNTFEGIFEDENKLEGISEDKHKSEGISEDVNKSEGISEDESEENDLIFSRKYVIERDPTNKEKILRSNDLNILLAVDGFCGYCPNDLKNYINNLKYANDGDKHINAVREMYNLEILRNLSGTDASCIVFLALLTIYKKSIKDDQAILILENVISNVRNYLMKNAQFYGDIANAVNNINDLIEFYEFAIDPCEMEKISTMKIVDIINKSKKKKNITFVKRGRKKNDYEPTKKRKIVMPLNSDSEQE
ncbi:hypothetical protein TNCT_171641 [Trichonephila clavata]|uniref:Uncharacterized protein n=1 Tax=Trichonephila clavata TaxID=2740835 RepID=A0A8X6L6C0_TRICU|nr:hypothetical protein TNCT_171641 [Trichonephila clavata]